MSFCVGYTGELHQTFVSRRDSTQFLSLLFPQELFRGFFRSFQGTQTRSIAYCSVSRTFYF
jgi:hypothetical protein